MEKTNSQTLVKMSGSIYTVGPKSTALLTPSYLCLLWSAADGNNLFNELLLLQLDGFLHCDLTEGVHRVLHPICHHAGVIWLHANLSTTVQQDKDIGRAIGK